MKRVLGDGATCCGANCGLCSSPAAEPAPVVDAVIDDPTLMNDPDDEEDELL